jgi:hypothetical protein
VKSAAASTIAGGRGELRILALLGALGASFVLASPAIAAPPAPPAVAGKGSLARARELFFKGVTEQSAGNWAQALAYFQQSLAESSTWRSTLNAASCLAKLGRYDEALDTYDGLLASFAAELDPADRAKIDAAIAYLQQKVATVEITANLGATILLDGRSRGEVPRNGPLVLHLTADTHRMEIVKSGFKPYDRTMAFVAGDRVLVQADLERLPGLAPEPAPTPRAPRPSRPHPFLSAFSGGVLSGSLGSTVERRESGLPRSLVGGFFGGARGGYAFSSGLAIEVSAGYLAAVSSLHRTVDSAYFFDKSTSQKTPLAYDLHDTLRIRGPFFGLGASYRIALDDRLSLLARTTFGLLVARSTDPVTGKVCSGAGCAPNDGVSVVVNGNAQILESTSGFLLPELGVETTRGAFRASLSLGLFIFTSDGVGFTGRTVGVDRAKCTATSAPGNVACAPNKALGEADPGDVLTHAGRELAFGKFALLWIPKIEVGYSF